MKFLTKIWAGVSILLKHHIAMYDKGYKQAIKDMQHELQRLKP